mmetsp:Transcript_2166/g.4997  ORF Transcript_2166/g.4997 Transcript_2166/m.4997 type:complete len:123 (+) Transcript_2166:160-528(+)
MMFLAPYCSRASDETNPNDTGFFFVDCGWVVLKDRKLHVYEHSEWLKYNDHASSYLTIDLSSGTGDVVVSARKFKSEGQNFFGGRIRLHGTFEPARGKESIHLLLETDDYNRLRMAIKQLMS